MRIALAMKVFVDCEGRSPVYGHSPGKESEYRSRTVHGMCFDRGDVMLIHDRWCLPDEITQEPRLIREHYSAPSLISQEVEVFLPSLTLSTLTSMLAAKHQPWHLHLPATASISTRGISTPTGHCCGTAVRTALAVGSLAMMIAS